MCNLFSQIISPDSLRAFFGDMGLDVSEAALSRNYKPGYVGADADGDVIRWSSQGHSVSADTLRWGLPPISKGKKPITNIRNLDSKWWTNVNGAYLREAEYRVLVPFDRFAEWSVADKANAWFSTTTDVSFFAGIWRPWNGERLKAVEGEKRRKRMVDDWELFSFLTTETNDVVAPIHPKAMPVILTTVDEAKAWLAGGAESLALQRPLAAELLQQVK